MVRVEWYVLKIEVSIHSAGTIGDVFFKFEPYDAILYGQDAISHKQDADS